ncbi:FAD-binding oxidoreductase [Candidatus Chloroploca sp. M-50]|uniref:FAD-binding oxidoreductase n=1 Tax=Candidatus Chloroploca mongolica TaxID=2528176 RepID=A0ABS4DE90_9CHLR|nr:FAD-dependent oxidoreductase [Candidatus Chloroploca mongolica]MBP1467748.1 FAD-binding oxidoreductase [Candidatus Chloroploca mongolica]
MNDASAEVVICGAGIAGIATAYELAVTHGVRGVVLVEQGDPLALTSDKSSEAYRNWWPDEAMVALMNRSLDRLEALASDHALLLNRRGYLYVTLDPVGAERLHASAQQVSAAGAGPLRVHRAGASGVPYVPASAHGFADQPDGADMILDRDLLQQHFPCLTEQAVAALHVRRAGWFSARQLGMLMLEQARATGVQLLRGHLSGVEVAGGAVRGVQVDLVNGGTTKIATRALVSAAGPLQQTIGTMLGLKLPIYNELHLKLSFNDQLGIVPRDAPLLILNDPVVLPWETEEREALAEDPALRWLLDPLPAGAHGRPEGGPGATTLLLLWDYHTTPVEPIFPLPVDPVVSEVVLRGMATLIPGLAAYLERLPQSYVDGGYYTRTRENRPLVGPLPVEGTYIIGALGGFGLMAACGASELVAAHVVGASLPAYAPAFDLRRYDDAAYMARLAQWGDVGQL